MLHRTLMGLAALVFMAVALSAGPVVANDNWHTTWSDPDYAVFDRISGTRKTISYRGEYAPGTIIVRTSERKLYYVLEGGKALQYGIGVGREGFQWSGKNRVTRKAEWPSWRPPAEMIKRQPDLPRFMPGGPKNPLGARALYIGNTLYRIHGTNAASTIGRAVSSGCIRMLNSEVIDLFNRVKVGARVVVTM